MNQVKMLTNTEVISLETGTCPICKSKELFWSELRDDIGNVRCSKGHVFRFRNERIYEFVKQIKFDPNVTV